MLLNAIAQFLENDVKTSNGSKQVQYAALSEELILIDQALLPYTIRLVGHANQVVIVEKISATEEKKTSKLVTIYKTPALNFEDMPDLKAGIVRCLNIAKRHAEEEDLGRGPLDSVS